MRRILNALVPFIALAGGVLFLVMGFQSAQKHKTYTPVEAVITDIIVSNTGADDEDTTHDVIVEYTVDGQDYESHLGEYSASMHIGKAVEVRYNPANPAEIVSGSSVGIILEFGFGALLLVCGVVLILKRLTGR